MTHKKHVKQTVRRLERVKTWQLVLLFILMAFVSATLLRLNNVGMVQRREAVLQADQEGDAQTIHNRLYELQAYALQHMNASTDAIYLTEQYTRDSQAMVAAARDDTSNKTTVFKQADNICKPQYTGWTSYVQCMSDQLDKMQIASDAGEIKVTFPDPSLYRHIYASPLWSPDFAGFSVLITLVILLVIIVRLIAIAILRAMLHWQYRRAR